MNSVVRTILLWTSIIILVVVLYQFLSVPHPEQVEMSFSQFMSEVEAGRISKVIITGSEITGDRKELGPDGQPKKFSAYAPDYPDLVKDLRQYKIDIEVGSSRVDLQACKLEYSIVSPK